MLQRGRTQSGAESLSYGSNRDENSRASTGPHSIGCGKSFILVRDDPGKAASTGPHSIGCGKLGKCITLHGKKKASTGPHSIGCGKPEQSKRKPPRHICFNGAALNRVRKAGQRPRINAPTFQLQRGRTQSGAERLDESSRLKTGGGASTGPHSIGCGKEPRLATARWRGKCFNGAALNRVRKVFPLNAWMVPPFTASTGPHSIGCGKSYHYDRTTR